MVGLVEIQKSNAKFASQNHAGMVCVFAGATAGIGLATLTEMVDMVKTSTFYVLGRNAARYQDKIEALRKRGPTNRILLVETQVALISKIDEACAMIGAAERKVDLVCVSPGGMPFQGATFTDEGLESCFVVSYYARLRIISNLMPLLRQSKSPRVLSILNGTKETKIDEKDIGLDKGWGIVAVVNHTTLCTSLAFDYLATNNNGMIFIHATPGFVSTDTPRTAHPSRENGLVWWALISLFQIVSGWVIFYFGMAATEAGQRFAYVLTNENFVPGSWQTNRLSEIVPANAILMEYRERGWSQLIWDFTHRVWERALAKAAV